MSRQFEACETADADRRGVGQGICVGHVLTKRGIKLGQSNAVQADYQQLGRGGGQDLIEDDSESRVRHNFKAQGRLAHLTNPLAEGLDMLGAEIGVM